MEWRLHDIWLRAAEFEDMFRDFPESDWKKLRALHPLALDRFSKIILDEIAAISADGTKTSHQRYVAVWQHLRQRDRDVADAFDDMSRSKGPLRIAHFGVCA